MGHRSTTRVNRRSRSRMMEGISLSASTTPISGLVRRQGPVVTRWRNASSLPTVCARREAPSCIRPFEDTRADTNDIDPSPFFVWMKEDWQCHGSAKSSTAM
nr:hypothetical protein CFP56_69084 [Quercus suber]